MTSRQALTETATVLHELMKCLNSSDDEQLIRSYMTQKNDMITETQRQQLTLKQTIKELTSKTTDLHATTATSPSLPHLQMQQTLEQQKSILQQQIAQTESAVSRESNLVKQQQHTITTLEKSKQEMQTEAQLKIPNIKSTVKLYTNISNISWDYDCGDDIAGTVVGSRGIHEFHYPAPKCLADRHATANALWDLMWEYPVQ